MSLQTQKGLRRPTALKKLADFSCEVGKGLFTIAGRKKKYSANKQAAALLGATK